MKKSKLTFNVLLLLILVCSCQTQGKKSHNDSEEETTSDKVITELFLDEDRGVDSENPPITLDIIGARKDIEELSASQIAKNFRYTKLTHPFEKDFLNNSKIIIGKHFILATTIKGIALFDKEGDFVEMLTTDGKKYEETDSQGPYMSYVITKEITENYVGSFGNPLIIGDKVYYKYKDTPKKLGYMMAYTPTINSTDIVPQDESKSDSPKGDVVGKVDAQPSFSSKPIFSVSPHSYIEIDEKYDSANSGVFLTHLSWQGDTICKFRDYDRELNIKRNYRNAEETIFYRNNDELFVRQCYNDTIFQLIFPNKLKAKYVLDFGGKGINKAQEGLSIGVDLEDRYVVNDITMIGDLLLVRYTQNYICPNTAEEKKLKYNLYVYDTKTQRGYHPFIDEAPYNPLNSEQQSSSTYGWPIEPFRGIINDSEGLDINLSNVKISDDGQLYFIKTGKRIKGEIKEKGHNQPELEQFAESLDDEDTVIVFLE